MSSYKIFTFYNNVRIQINEKSKIRIRKSKIILLFFRKRNFFNVQKIQLDRS